MGRDSFLWGKLSGEADERKEEKYLDASAGLPTALAVAVNRRIREEEVDLLRAAGGDLVELLAMEYSRQSHFGQLQRVITISKLLPLQCGAS